MLLKLLVSITASKTYNVSYFSGVMAVFCQLIVSYIIDVLS